MSSGSPAAAPGASIICESSTKPSTRAARWASPRPSQLPLSSLPQQRQPARWAVEDHAASARHDAPEDEHAALPRAGSVLLWEESQLGPDFRDVLEVARQSVAAAVGNAARSEVGADGQELELRIDELDHRLEVAFREGGEHPLHQLEVRSGHPASIAQWHLTKRLARCTLEPCNQCRNNRWTPS